MRIQHNITAMNSYRNYTNNTSAVAKNLEKLSSGYKINRAGDDAAGLAISEKMRAQITGLKTAQKNAKDGVSLVKTAEGALTEVHDMLNRMYELAEQSANGTYDDTVDRANLQKEVDSLRSEINRIADSVNFNGINLLDGSLGGAAKIATTPGVDSVGTFTATAQTLTDLGLSSADLTGLAAGASPVIKVTDGVEAAAAKSGETTIKGGRFVVTGTDGTAMNGKTITVTFAGDTVTPASAKVDNDGNIAVVLSATTAGLSAVNKTGADGANALADAINAALANATADDAATEEQVDAWKSATVAVTDGSSYDATAGNVFAASGSVMSTVNLANGVDEVKAKVSVEVSGTEVAAYESADHTFSRGEIALTARGDSGVSGTITIDNSSKLTNTNATAGGKALGSYSETTAGTGAVTTLDFTGKTGGDVVGATIKVGGTTYEFTKDGAAAKTAGATAINLATGDDATATDIADALAAATTASVTDGSETYTVASANGKVTLTNNTAGTASKAAAVTQGGTGLTLQIGDTADSFNQLTVSVSDMHAAAMGIGDIDIGKQGGASDAMAKIKAAINYVSDGRGTLGATQNRLEHTMNNLSVMQENIQDAESSIRDVDVAEEMMAYTKNNILVQSAQAMLAQANQLPQGVLQLLQ